jgi:hypothetical protein
MFLHQRSLAVSLFSFPGGSPAGFSLLSRFRGYLLISCGAVDVMRARERRGHSCRFRSHADSTNFSDAHTPGRTEISTLGGGPDGRYRVVTCLTAS